jgi:hypothetical protein
MKKFVVFCFALLVVQGQSFAQSFFSLQLEVAEPTDSFRDAAGTGFGFKGTYMHFITSRMALTGSAGYVKWGPRVDFPPNNEYKFVSIPVQIGTKFLLSKSVIAPYVGISVGMDYLRTRGLAANSTSYSDTSELKFGFSTQVGVGIYLVGPLGVNLTGSYNVIHTASSPSKYFGLNAGLAVGF